ncbi:dihydroxyacetone kinase Ecym_1148 [Eremothecium cymbalariae DBVPG|uniref:Dihydroxyacetone kinase n=1 Tax=Eremothecium cymbalariae (strain CBS 270.75 / DBVPG 7215 / KCTC 17166 / NRRL Y-17582) TaxID=931890 RepID=G8JMP5_ERECY|nr:hypothetical protein Ecym_1148 [Eremothecium cymbalariae DBVPG\
MSFKSFELSNPLHYSLQGFALANPHITLIPEYKIFFRNSSKDKVALISGGGSGHEPAHAGYIGSGMLCATVAGEIFASPSSKQILNAIKVVEQNSSGVLLIVKNYTGDVLHFGIAAERARTLGINCEVVIVGDDVAVGRNKGGLVGRRGLAGTVLVHKITGAFAERLSFKYGLEGTSKVANIVKDNLVTIGASLTHCKVPGREFESQLNENQMELGMGIHNEHGVEILEPIPSTVQLVEKSMLPLLLDPNDSDRYFVNFEKSDDVVLLVNNLGGVSNFMISAITLKTNEILKEKYGIRPKKTIQGTLMTSLDGNGFSITLLNASNCNRQLQKEFPELDSVLELLEAYTNAPGWPGIPPPMKEAPSIDSSLFEQHGSVKPAGKFSFKLFEDMMKAGAAQIILNESKITHLDNIVGDGDCGATMVAGVQCIVENLDNLSRNSLSEALAQLSNYIENFMGGTSGGLYSILISGMSHGLITSCNNPDAEVTPQILAKSLLVALQTLYNYTKARPGDCTMIDALEPFVRTYAEDFDFEKALKASEAGASATKEFTAKFGRASYVSETLNVLDPGAVGLVEFLKGMNNALKHSGNNHTTD